MASVFGDNSRTIQDLPEHILLNVFLCLQVKDLCKASSVCRQWRRVGGDHSLWRHVDFRPYKLNLHKMWKVLRTRFDDSLVSLQLRGYLNPSTMVAARNKSSISDAILQDIGTRCSNLRNLSITMTNLAGVSVSSLPQNLVRLSITHCSTYLHWFKQQPADNVPTALSSVIHLDLSSSTKVSDGDIEDIAQQADLLETLSLHGCYRVTGTGLKTVADRLVRLRRLDIAETRCNDLALHHICRNLTRLQSLDVSGCADVRDGGAATIFCLLTSLERVVLSGCRQVTDVGVNSADACRSLRNLDVCGTQVTAAACNALRSQLPNCIILNDV